MRISLRLLPRERLGGVLQFDAAQSRRLFSWDISTDADAIWSDRGEIFTSTGNGAKQRRYFALQELCRLFIKEETPSLRALNETILPKLAKHLKVKDGGYYDLLTALLERLAERQGISAVSGADGGNASA